MSTSLSQYRDRLAPARRRLKDQPRLRALMEEETDPEILHAFLIQWAALSIQLQEPAERFLVESSRRCSEVGEHRLSLTLLQVASEAIDRYRLMADDTRRLAQLWNARRLPHIDLTYLLTQAQTPSMKRLHAHQHALVTGTQPWTELAAIYEADAMLGSIAERVAAQAQRLLGEDALACLRSLDALAHFDQRASLGKTMAQFLDTHPECIERMAEVGERTLEIYTDFLIECCDAATEVSTWGERRHASG